MASGVRVYALLARDRHRAVIFRRGPSKQVLVLGWRTDNDTFYLGQWLKGRIYERRCDLSPRGQRLVYFAAKFRGSYYSWTAVSRPPYLTALALWPKTDTWGGGGLFASEDEILLNHSAVDFRLAKGFTIPETVRVREFGVQSGEGEGEPIMARRLTRDGWVHEQKGNPIYDKTGSSLWTEFTPKDIWFKNHPKGYPFQLRMVTHGVHQKRGPWYAMDHVVRSNQSGDSELLLRTSDWADWCHSGDLLYAMDGGIYRLGFDSHKALRPISDARKLIDLRGLSFVARPSPFEAKDWSAAIRIDGQDW